MLQPRFALLAALLASLILASSASADTVEVDTNTDDSTGCTLRDALDSQNQGTSVNDCTLVVASGRDEVTFAPALSGQTITLIGPPLVITGNFDVIGPGMDQLTIDQSGADRVLVVSNDAAASISGLTMTGGHPDPDPGTGPTVGGAIVTGGHLALTDVLVAGNTVAVSRAGDAFAAGGGIFNVGQLDLDHSIVVANTATATNTDTASSYAYARGAGVFSTGSGTTLDMNDSTIADNVATASFDGTGTTQATGGLDSLAGFSAQNSTFSGNTASATQDGSGPAWGIDVGSGTYSIEQSTVAANRADASGSATVASGGILTESDADIRIENSTIAFNGPATGSADGANLNVGPDSTASLSNTIVSDPRGGGINCLGFGHIESLGSNVLYPADGPGCFTSQSSDQDNDPFLATAAPSDNGGPNETIALQPDSPAIDAGSGGALTDQRGLSRPLDFAALPNASSGDGTDIGAFEVQRACPNQGSPQDVAVCYPTGPAGPTGQRAAAMKQCKKLKGKAKAKKRKKCLARAARRPV